MIKYYLRIPEIDGESTDGAHFHWMDIESYSRGDSRGQGGAGGYQERATLSDYHFTKKMDKASASLMLATASGQHFPKVTLEGAKQLTHGWQHKIIEYVFEDVMITSYSYASSAGSDDPIEVFSLSFAKMTYNLS